MSEPVTRADWLLADIFLNKEKLFILWAIRVKFCTRIADFHYHFGDDLPIETIINKLETEGFIQRDDVDFVLTTLGEQATSYINDLTLSEFAKFDRKDPSVETRFQPLISLLSQARLSKKTFDQFDENTVVENAFLEQLDLLGWEISRDRTGTSYRKRSQDVLLKDILYQAILNINDDIPSLSEEMIVQVINTLERLPDSGRNLLEKNEIATHLLTHGIKVKDSVNPDQENHLRVIDFERPQRNNFLAINQFHIDTVDYRTTIIPDIVLFVNGIPLIVVECKNPMTTNPVGEAITQLFRYSGQGSWLNSREAVPQLFYYNQLLVATCFYEARVGTIGAYYEHFQEWKDTAPVKREDCARELGVTELKSQQLLVAGILRPEHLLKLVHHFILFHSSGGRRIKIFARYQQFRSVQYALQRLEYGKTRQQTGDRDERSGIIWHTQGSGKSLTMVFLIRSMRAISKLRPFKIIFVTDRIDLENQLFETASLTDEPIDIVIDIEELPVKVGRPGPEVIFAMIQKYRVVDLQIDDVVEEKIPAFPVLNPSEDILVIVDEAHRSQSRTLHANLETAFPNCAMIGFTGTPIMMGDEKKTEEIFGTFIDKYTLQQSEADRATVPIFYEGYKVALSIEDQQLLDTTFAEAFRDQSSEEKDLIIRRYARVTDILESQSLIDAKARHILRHYVATVLPNRMKAIVVATTRLAAARYALALAKARDELIQEIDLMDSTIALESVITDTQRFLVQAGKWRDVIAALQFTAVYTHMSNEKYEELRIKDDNPPLPTLIERFRQPLIVDNGTRHDPLAFLCVQGMFLTGFDAPVVQVLYLDRFMRRHTLLQAIARVNRIYLNKLAGLVVDYIGLAHYVSEALDVYRVEDVQGALINIQDEIIKLDDRHRRVVAIFAPHSDTLIDHDIDECINKLSDYQTRANFKVKLHKFLESLDTVLPRREAAAYIYDARILSIINQLAFNVYQDSQLNILGAGLKVRELLDKYIIDQGIEITQEPIQVTDPNFERSLESFHSDETKASAMEHAARIHITEHETEDPVYYRKLSERLEEILQLLRGQWHELASALQLFVQKFRQGRPDEGTGLNPRTEVPFFAILEEEQEYLPVVSRTPREKLIEYTRQLVMHIKKTIGRLDFWQQQAAINQLRGWISNDFLDRYNLVEFERQEKVADQFVQMSRRNQELNT